MNSFSSSNRVLDFANRMRLTFSSYDDRNPRNDLRSLTEIRRALSRWENEGGAVHDNDTHLLDAHAALS